MPPNAKIDDKVILDFLLAFEEDPYIAIAAEKVGVSSSSIEKFMQSNEDFANAIANIRAKKKALFDKRLDEMAMTDAISTTDTPKGTIITKKRDLKAYELKMRRDNPELFNARTIQHKGAVQHFVALPEPKKIAEKSVVIEGEYEEITDKTDNKQDNNEITANDSSNNINELEDE